MLKKRSFSLSGHRTSVALEAEFWAVLDDCAVPLTTGTVNAMHASRMP